MINIKNPKESIKQISLKSCLVVAISVASVLVVGCNSSKYFGTAQDIEEFDKCNEARLQVQIFGGSLEAACLTDKDSSDKNLSQDDIIIEDKSETNSKTKTDIDVSKTNTSSRNVLIGDDELPMFYNAPVSNASNNVSKDIIKDKKESSTKLTPALQLVYGDRLLTTYYGDSLGANLCSIDLDDAHPREYQYIVEEVKDAGLQDLYSRVNTLSRKGCKINFWQQSTGWTSNIVEYEKNKFVFKASCFNGNGGVNAIYDMNTKLYQYFFSYGFTNSQVAEFDKSGLSTYMKDYLKSSCPIMK